MEIWNQNKHQQNTKASYPDLYYNHIISPSVHFASLDALSVPSHSSCFTLAHLLTNESFHLPLKCHSQQANTQHPQNNKVPDLCYRPRRWRGLNLEESSQFCHHLDSYFSLKPRGRGPRTSQCVSCGGDDILAWQWRCDVCEMCVDTSPVIH